MLPCLIVGPDSLAGLPAGAAIISVFLRLLHRDKVSLFVSSNLGG